MPVLSLYSYLNLNSAMCHIISYHQQSNSLKSTCCEFIFLWNVSVCFLFFIDYAGVVSLFLNAVPLWKSVLLLLCTCCRGINALIYLNEQEYLMTGGWEINIVCVYTHAVRDLLTDSHTHEAKTTAPSCVQMWD